MSRDEVGGRGRDLGVAGLLFALSVAFVSPVFRSFSNLGALDWDWNLFLQEVPRLTIVEYGQIPLWNPYEWGGIPMLGSPWSRVLAPSFPLVLAFGTVAGAKLDIWLHALIGLSGAYALGRQFAMSRTAAVFTACAYLLGSWFSLVAASGMSVLFGATFIPWAYFARLRARNDSRFVVVLGAICAVMFFDGSAEPLAILIAALGIEEAVNLLTRTTTARQALTVTVGAGATFAGLTAAKLVPAVELIRRFPRFPARTGGYSVESLFLALTERGQTVQTEFPPGTGFWRGMAWGMDETGAYVGLGFLSLATLGLTTNARRQPALAAALLLLVWTAFGDHAPFGPWHVLHSMPMYSFMRVPERFRFAFLVNLALFGGFGADALATWLTNARRLPPLLRRRAATVVGGFVAIATLDLLLANGGAFRDAFPIPPVGHPKSEHFIQLWRLPRYDVRGFLTDRQGASALAPSSSLFPAVRAGLGTARGFDPIIPRVIRVRVAGEEGYLGEQWLTGTTGTVRLVQWTPNRLTFDVAADREGILVVNQAFDPGWRSVGESRPAENQGLLSVPVRAGRQTLKLFYRPTTFVVGGAVSTITLFVLSAWFWVRTRRKVPGSIDDGAAEGPPRVVPPEPHLREPRGHPDALVRGFRL